jgi:hypothetical protein
LVRKRHTSDTRVMDGVARERACPVCPR